MAERVTVAIVDDQPLFSSGLSMLLDAEPDIDCLGCADDAPSGLDLVRRAQPDVVLMDLRMPGINGLDATRMLLSDPSLTVRPSVVVLTTIQHDGALYAAIDAGASAFLTKDATPADVLDTIRATASGREVDADALRLVREFGARARAADTSSVAVLSAREREIFLLVASGLSNQQIAQSAHLSEATVKTHVGAILTKLELRSRVQIVIFAYEHGLVAGRRSGAHR